MAGGGGRNRSLKTDYDPYSKDERESYQSSLKDIPGMSEWLEDKVGDWSNIKDDAGLGDRLTRKDFQDLIGGEDAENLFNFQSSRQGGNRNMFMPGMGIMGQGGRGIGALAGLGIGGGGRGLGGLALAQLMHRGCDIPCRSQSLHRLCYVAVDGARMFRLFARQPREGRPLVVSSSLF